MSRGKCKRRNVDNFGFVFEMFESTFVKQERINFEAMFQDLWQLRDDV